MKAFPRTLNKSFQSLSTSAMIGVLILCGILAVSFAAPQSVRDWEEVRKLHALDLENLAAATPYSRVLVTGVLQGNPTRTPDGLVAYGEQQRDIATVDSDSGAWPAVAPAWPPLSIQIDGQSLQLAQAEFVELGGHLHLETFSSSNDTLSDAADRGPVWTKGFKDGDPVTIIGRRDTDGRLIPARVYGGDRTALLRELSRDTWVAYLLGIAFILVALLIFFWRIVVQV